jgi:hypothetical protein
MSDTGQIAKRSNRQLMDVIAESAKQMASLAATIVQHAGELDRREGWRDDGATSLQDWLVGRLGVSTSTAKAYAHLSERLFDLPHLTAGLGDGELSLDKVRTLVDTATPESDRALARQARDLTVRELAEVARAKKRPSPAQDQIDHDKRSLRFNDVVRTLTAQLPPSSYAEVKACLEARAKRLPSDGETPLDQRLADAFMELVRTSGRRSPGSSTGYTALAHVPLEVLTDPASTLCGELDGAGLISADTVRELLCDATLIVAADDDKGHTMYEGRGARLATRHAAPRTDTARPPLLLPRLRQCALRHSAPSARVDRRREDRSTQPGLALRVPPSPHSLEAVERERQCERGAPLRGARRPGADLTTLATVGPGHRAEHTDPTPAPARTWEHRPTPTRPREPESLIRDVRSGIP